MNLQCILALCRSGVATQVAFKLGRAAVRLSRGEPVIRRETRGIEPILEVPPHAPTSRTHISGITDVTLPPAAATSAANDPPTVLPLITTTYDVPPSVTNAD